MNETETLAVLERMRVEQDTLKGLWGQFSVALGQVGEVIKVYQELAPAIPRLRSEHATLTKEVVDLSDTLKKGRAKVQEDVDTFRRTLAQEHTALSTAIDDAKERLRVATEQADNAERMTAKLQKEKDQEIAGIMARLATAQQALTKFKEDHKL